MSDATKKEARAARLEAQARRLRVERAAMDDKAVWRALRVHDLSVELAAELAESLDAGKLARQLEVLAADLLLKLGAPL